MPTVPRVPVPITLVLRLSDVEQNKSPQPSLGSLVVVHDGPLVELNRRGRAVDNPFWDQPSMTPNVRQQVSILDWSSSLKLFPLWFTHAVKLPKGIEVSERTWNWLAYRVGEWKNNQALANWRWSLRFCQWDYTTRKWHQSVRRTSKSNLAINRETITFYKIRNLLMTRLVYHCVSFRLSSVFMGRINKPNANQYGESK